MLTAIIAKFLPSPFLLIDEAPNQEDDVDEEWLEVSVTFYQMIEICRREGNIIDYN